MDVSETTNSHVITLTNWLARARARRVASSVSISTSQLLDRHTTKHSFPIGSEAQVKEDLYWTQISHDIFHATATTAKPADRVKFEFGLVRAK